MTELLLGTKKGLFVLEGEPGAPFEVTARAFAGEPVEYAMRDPRSGRVLDPSRMRRRFQDAARRAELRPVRFHDLRHTFATRMAAAGAPLRAIQDWLGHSDYRTTSIYADYAPDLTQGAVWAARAFPPGDGSAP